MINEIKKNHLFFWVFTLAITFLFFVLIFCLNDMPESDGLTYAAIARNMAEGVGSFWHPHFSLYRYSQFYDHPSLGFIMLSWFYRWFGDHVFVEKAYSALTTLLTWLVLYAIAKQFYTKLRWYRSWMLILPWLLIPTNDWFYASNLFEPVGGLFGLIALYFLIVSYQRHFMGVKLYGSLCAAALAVTISLYINGPPVLYIWVVEWCLLIAYSRGRFWYHCKRWFFLLLFTVCLFLLFTPAHHNFFMYLKLQVMPSLQGKRYARHLGWHHFDIIKDTLRYTWTLFVVSMGVWAYLRVKLSKQMKKDGLFFLLLVFVSLLPIVLTPKQYLHYTLHSNSFFVLLAFVCLAATVDEAVSAIKSNGVAFKVFAVSAVVLFASSLIICVLNIYSNHSFLNRGYEREVDYIASVVGKGATISVTYVPPIPSRFEGYLQRLYKINFQQQQRPTHRYYMQENYHAAKPPAGYKMINLPLKYSHLYERIKN
ncbi:MAG: hypothetical protein P1U34_02180 [Coxiellaceae bacterium]|nr:hypothetical protein [Coxiellaceae bacterium]